MKKNIIFSAKYGMCAGVKNALNIVNQSLTNINNTIYIYHEIVHNSFVINDLKKKNIVFCDDINDIPNNSTVIFSAHGVSKKIEELAQEKNCNIIDATCPLVKKNHNIIEQAELDDQHIIFVGTAGHAEAEGSQGRIENNQNFSLIEKLNDIDNLVINNKNIILLSQTTLSKEKLSPIEERLKALFPTIKNCGGLCNATTSRQDAIKDLAIQTDVILIIGSPNSSNSRHLVEIVKSQGKNAFLVENLTDLANINLDNYQNIGISAGASTPQEQIDLIVNNIN